MTEINKNNDENLNVWVDKIFKFSNKKIVKLDDTYTAHPTPSDFKIGLYPHQEIAVQAMLDLERKRYINAEDDNNNTVIVDNQACILSEKLGSGKTIEILALICIQQQPSRIVPDNINMVDLKIRYNGFAINHNPTSNISTEIRRRYSSVLHPNIIVVGKSVLLQWERAIRTFTYKTYFTISDQKTLKEFYNMYRRGIVNYDIILLKNSTTSNFYLAKENPNETSQIRYLPDIVAKICENTPFSRAIYDDFDTINISRDVIKINALYTIFVSTTHNSDNTRNYWLRINLNKEYDTPLNMINDFYGNRRLMDVFTDTTLFRIFNIRNSEKFVKKSTNIPIYKTYKCVYTNPANTYIELMGNLGAAEVVEMMNGDATRTAADTLGITGNSPFEIFKKLLKNKYDTYMNNKLLLNNIIKVRDYVNTLVDMKDRPHYTDDKGNEKNYPANHSDNSIQTIIKDIRKMHKTNNHVRNIVKFKSQKLNAALNDFQIDTNRKYEVSGIEINRMKENLKEQVCVVCKMDTDGEDVLIPRCCSNIIDSDCFKDDNMHGNTNGIMVKCPGCGQKVDLGRDVVYIKGEFDLESLLEADGTETLPEPEKIERAEEDKIDNPKLQALWDILNKKRPEHAEEIKFQMNAVIEGRVDIPPKDTVRKVLLFANFNETLELVEDFLKTRKLEYLRLQGTYKQMDIIIDDFKKKPSIPVLLINSQQNCAGLNLQFATTVVFFHKLINRHVESQVIGRAQRIGRKSNLEIYYLLYTNESNSVGNNKDIDCD